MIQNVTPDKDVHMAHCVILGLVAENRCLYRSSRAGVWPSYKFQEYVLGSIICRLKGIQAVFDMAHNMERACKSRIQGIISFIIICSRQ